MFKNPILLIKTLSGVLEDFPILIILLVIRQETGEVFTTEEGKISFWLAVISMFFKASNYMYYSLGISGGDYIERKRSRGAKCACAFPPILIQFIITLFFALHPTLWNSKDNSNHKPDEGFNQTYNQSLNQTYNKA